MDIGYLSLDMGASFESLEPLGGWLVVGQLIIVSLQVPTFDFEILSLF